jgi:hypothetical protein
MAFGLGYIGLTNTAADRLTVPDSSALSTFTSGIDLRADIALVDWVDAAYGCILQKGADGSTAEQAFEWGMWADGKMYLHVGDGTTLYNANGTVGTSTAVLLTAASLSDGDRCQVRVSCDLDDGSGNRVYKFWYRTDGSLGTDGSDTGWTQLGTTLTEAGTLANLKDNTSSLHIGSRYTTAALPMDGKIYRVKIYNDHTSGTLVLDANATLFTAANASAGTFTDSSDEAATITLNNPTNMELHIDWQNIAIWDYLGTNHASGANFVVDISGLDYQDDDILFAVVGVNNSGVNIDETASTWTKLFAVDGTGKHFAAFAKRASGTETNPDFEDIEGTGNQTSILVLVIRGVDTTSMFDLTHNWTAGNHIDEAENTPNPTNQAITTETDDALVIVAQMMRGFDAAVTPGDPSGYHWAAALYEARDEAKVVISAKEIASAGAESPGAWTHGGADSGLDSYWGSFAFRLQQASSAGLTLSAVVGPGKLLQT